LIRIDFVRKSTRLGGVLKGCVLINAPAPERHA
jgi:hypothetical protein